MTAFETDEPCTTLTRSPPPLFLGPGQFFTALFERRLRRNETPLKPISVSDSYRSSGIWVGREKGGLVQRAN